MLDEKNVTLQIFGSLLKNSSILDRTDKYSLTANDFSSPFEKRLFAVIFNLHSSGARSIGITDIENYLKDTPSTFAIWEREKGADYLLDAEDLSDEENFDYYYKKLKKINLLKALRRAGYDISEFYVEDPLNPRYQEINEKFDSLTTTDITNSFRKKLNKIESDVGLNKENKTSFANYNARKLIEDLKVLPDTGPRLQGKFFNTIVRGARRGKFFLRSSGSGMGKALPNYTKIPTPTGWKRVDEIQVGDYLFDRLGRPTKVLAVFPQPQQKQIYKVVFKSGRIAECCDEHLWSFYDNYSKKRNVLHTKTLKEIMNDPRWLADRPGFRYSIPLNQPVQYGGKKYSIDPYVMGLILGDGSFRYDKSQKAFSFSSNVEDILNNYPELWQAKSEDKFIPQEYLMGSVEQRFDLLAGLLDTDGSIDAKGRISFTTISSKMRDGVIELCESLGMICTYSTDKRSTKYTTGECYNLHIQTSKENTIKMFKLTRKLEKAEQYYKNNKRTESRDRDAIVEIIPTNAFTDMTCFLVDNDEHLFLMNNFICTHNTRRSIGDACYLSYPIRYNTQTQEWSWDGGTEKTLIIVTEQEEDEIQTMILAYLSGVNEDNILFSTYEEGEEERIQKALQIMDIYQDNLRICRMPNPNIEQIQQVIRAEVLENDVGYIFYDYIFLNPALLNEFRDLKMADHQVLGMMSAALKDLAVELNVFIFSSTQLNAQGEDTTKNIKNESAIRGSRAIVDKVDMGCIVTRPTDEDLHVVESFCTKIPNAVIDVYKMRRGRYTQVRIWSYVDLGTCRTEDLLVTDGKLHPVAVGNLKQQYDEERWDILENVRKLNCGEEMVVEATDFTEEMRDKIESKKNDLFGGLL